MNSDLTDLIAALRDGTLSLQEVAQRFRERPWPRTKGQPPRTFLGLATAAERDPEAHKSGSFDEVAAAYRRGQLSSDEYQVLAEAAAESIRADESASRDRERGGRGWKE